MATRKTITKAQAVRYRMGPRAVKSEILDVACAVTGYHRDYARPSVTRPASRPTTVTRRHEDAVGKLTVWLFAGRSNQLRQVERRPQRRPPADPAERPHLPLWVCNLLRWPIRSRDGRRSTRYDRMSAELGTSAQVRG